MLILHIAVVAALLAAAPGPVPLLDAKVFRCLFPGGVGRISTYVKGTDLKQLEWEASYKVLDGTIVKATEANLFIEKDGSGTRSGSIVGEDPRRSKISIIRSAAGVTFVEVTEGGDVQVFTVSTKRGPGGYLAQYSIHGVQGGSPLASHGAGYCRVETDP